MLPTTLETILYLFCFGSAIGILSVFLFGLAVRRRDTNIAPRCTARPADTIYSFGPFTAKNASQNRGNPFTGWVNWTLKLSYGTMLKGIPGTGTRANGIKGKMLDVNLDGIVLLRFHGKLRFPCIPDVNPTTTVVKLFLSIIIASFLNFSLFF